MGEVLVGAAPGDRLRSEGARAAAAALLLPARSHCRRHAGMRAAVGRWPGRPGGRRSSCGGRGGRRGGSGLPGGHGHWHLGPQHHGRLPTSRTSSGSASGTLARLSRPSSSLRQRWRMSRTARAEAMTFFRRHVRGHLPRSSTWGGRGSPTGAFPYPNQLPRTAVVNPPLAAGVGRLAISTVSSSPRRSGYVGLLPDLATLRHRRRPRSAGASPGSSAWAGTDRRARETLRVEKSAARRPRHAARSARCTPS